MANLDYGLFEDEYLNSVGGIGPIEDDDIDYGSIDLTSPAAAAVSPAVTDQTAISPLDGPPLLDPVYTGADPKLLAEDNYMSNDRLHPFPRNHQPALPQASDVTEPYIPPTMSATELNTPKVMGALDNGSRPALADLLQSLAVSGAERAEFADNLVALEQHQQSQTELKRLTQIFDTVGPTVAKRDANLNSTISGIEGVPGKFTYATAQGDVPVDDEFAKTEIAKGNLFQKNNNAISRGVGKVRSAFNMMAYEFNLKNPDEFARMMGELHRIYPQAPPEIQAGLKQIIEAKTNRDAIIAIFGNPNAVISVVGESLVSSIPSIAAFIGTTAVAGPVVGSAAGGIISGANEYALTLIGAIQETGVDLEDTAAVVELLGDKEFMAKAREKGAIRGMAIGTFDALSMGLAGKLTAMASAAGKSKPVVGAALTGDLLAQGVFGATGEGIAQKGEQYFGHRVDKDGYPIPISRGEILLEGIAELVPGGVEILLTSKSATEKAQYNRLMKELNAAQTDAEAQEIQSYVLNLLSPSSVEYQGEGELSVNDARVVGKLDALAERAIALGGNNGAFGNGIRKAIEASEKNGTPIRPEQIDFYRNKIGEMEAEANAQIPDQKGTFEEFLLTDKSQKRDQTVKLAELMEGADAEILTQVRVEMDAIANKIRDLGYNWKTGGLKGLGVNHEANQLRSTMSELSGTAVRLIQKQTAANRGYKEPFTKPKAVAAIAKLEEKIAATTDPAELEKLNNQLRRKKMTNQEIADEAVLKIREMLSGLQGASNQGPSIVTSAPTPPNADAGVGNAGVDAAPIEDGPTTTLNPAGTADAALFGDTPAVDTVTPDEATPAYPKPNEYGVYSEQDAKPEDKFKTEFKKGSLGGAEITVLEIEPSKWIVSTITRFNESGGSSPLSTAGPKYGSREEAIATSVSFLRQGAIDRSSDSKTFLAQKKKMREFLDNVSSQIGTVPAEVTPVEPPVEPPAEVAPAEPPAEVAPAEPPAEVAPAEPPAEVTPAEEVTPTEEVTPVEEVNPQAPTETPVGTDVGKKVESVRTPQGTDKYNVKGAVIDLDELIAAEGPNQQNRDRTVLESGETLRKRAAPATKDNDGFEPRLLIDSVLTSQGSPIIARNGTILAGNGRAIILDLVYNEHAETSLVEYKKALVDAGITVPEGMKRPVYVRQLQDDMTIEEIRNFVDRSNTSDQEAMSVEMVAKNDAARMKSGEFIGLYRGGDITSAENKQFLMKFREKVVDGAEANAFSRNGELTRQGRNRIENAILAAAFDDQAALSLMLDSPIKSVENITRAYMKAAPRLAQIKAGIASGNIEPDLDITEKLTETIKIIAEIRKTPSNNFKNKMMKPVEWYEKGMDFGLGGMDPRKDDPFIRALIGAFYKDDMETNRKAADIDAFLEYFVDEIMLTGQVANDMFGAKPDPMGMIDSAKGRVKDDGKESEGFQFEEQVSGQSNEAGGKQVQRREMAGGGKNTRSRRRGTGEEKVNDNNRSQSETTVEVDPKLRGTTAFEADQVVIEGRTRGGKPGTIFDKEASNLRQSLFLQAYTDANFDPALAVNYSAERQYSILSDLVKEKFGFSYIQKGEMGGTKDAVDSLLDAYRNLQWMTHTLQIGNTSIGLDGSLGLVLPSKAWGGFLAAYVNKKGGLYDSPTDAGKVQAPTIIMPGKSTSFAHEWGHALDYHILDKMGVDWGSGITGRIRTNSKAGEKVWLDSTPADLKEAMGDLMNVMFFDKASLAAKIMEYEQAITKAEAIMAKKKSLVEPKYLVLLREKLRKITDGETRARIAPSNYKKDALQFAADNKSNPNYWKKPTEMFARAFESYVAHKVAGISNTASTEFISSSKEAYDLTVDQVAGADDRLALTYPNQPERDLIFLAMDRVIDKLRGDMLAGPAAEKPGDYDMLDAHADFYAGMSASLEKKEAKEWFEAEKRTWRVAQQKMKELKARPSAYFQPNMTRGGLYKMAPTAVERFLKSGMVRFEDNFLAQLVSTKRGHLFTLASRYKDNPDAKAMIEKIIERVASDPGSLDDRVTGSGGAFEEAVRIEGRRFTSKLKTAMSKHDGDLHLMSKEQKTFLRLLLTSDEAAYQNLTKSEGDQKIKAMAADIRTKVLNPIYDYMRRNKLDVNYVPDAGYMPRLLDTTLAIDNLSHFKYGVGNTQESKGDGSRGAYHLYKNVIYENELGPFDLGNADQIREMLSMATPLMETKERAGYIQKGTDLFDAITKMKKLQKEIDKLGDQMAESDDPDAIEAHIEQLVEEQANLHGEVYDNMSNFYAEALSDNWTDRMQMSLGIDLQAQSVQGSFTKKRKLPPEADSYMVEFYLDPIESLVSYIPAAVRKTEYNKRFGNHLVPKGHKQRKGNMTPGMAPPSVSYLDYLLETEGALRGGMKKGELQEIRHIVETVTGTQASTGSQGAAAAFANHIHAYGTMALLPRAALSSIAEPMTVSIQTGKVQDGVRAFAYSLDEGLSMMQGSKKEQRAYNIQLANILGVIDDPNVGEMIANRMGGTVQEDPKLAARMSRFFVRIGLMGMTNGQRRASMRVGFQFLSELSAEITNPISEKSTKRASETLQDLGIRKEDQLDFAKWMVKAFEEKSDYSWVRRKTGTDNKMFSSDIGNLKIEETINKSGELTDMGALLSVAMVRFVDQSIQDPKIIDRPKYAEHPIGRIVYGIQSFIAAFTRGVHLHMLKRVAREYKNNGIGSATTVLVVNNLLPAVSLFGGHMIVSSIREALLNREKWEEEKEDDNLGMYLTKLALSRSGAAGRFDPILNGIQSLRYQADLTNVLVGSTPSYYLKAIQRLLGININNSDETVAAEYQFSRGAYDLVIPFLAAYMATSDKLSPRLGALAGITAAIATSPTAKHWILQNIIHQMTGEIYSPRGGGRQSGGSSSMRDKFQ